jgi:DNA polymerase-3 subunit delta'
LQVAAGTHPDFFSISLPPDKHELPVELFIGSRERRNQEGLCYDLSLKPLRGCRKIAVIDDADALNTESANCLLKTLEEPPAGAILILIGTAAELQLPTIRSRCQIVRFVPLDPNDVADLLVEQGIANDRKQAMFLANQSGGSVGLAAELADPELWRFRQALVQQLSDPGFDSVGLSQRVVEFVEAADKESAPRRARARQLVGFCRDLYRNVLLDRCGADAAPVIETDMAAVRRLGEHLVCRRSESEALEQAVRLVDRCLEADRHIDRRVQLSLALEALFDDLSRSLEPPTPVPAAKSAHRP